MFLKAIPPYWKPYLEMLHEMIGHPEKDKDLLTAASPVFHSDKIKVPLLHQSRTSKKWIKSEFLNLSRQVRRANPSKQKHTRPPMMA